MWIPVSQFGYDTSLFEPCVEQHGELVCFHRTAVTSKGVTAPLLSLPGAILLTCYKMESQVQGCMAHPFQLFPVSAGLHRPPWGAQFPSLTVLFPGFLSLEVGETGRQKKRQLNFFHE